MTTEYEPLLLLLELLVLQRMSSLVFKVLYSPLLCHDHPTISLLKDRADLLARTVKNLPAVQEAWVRSLGREDPPEKGMATHSSVLAWRIPGTGSLAGCRL